MPTTLPIRSSASHLRPRFPTRPFAALMLWALAMLALTLPVAPAHTADTEIIDFAAIDMVLP